jgi:hypothetical protein
MCPLEIVHGETRADLCATIEYVFRSRFPDRR